MNKFEADKLEYALGGWNVLDQDHDGCVAAEETIRSLNQQNLFRSDHPFVMPWLTHRDSLNAATASISAKLKEGVKVTIQNDLQNTTFQHGGRRRLDNAVVDMMIKHITDQVQDQLAISKCPGQQVLRGQRGRLHEEQSGEISQGRVEDCERAHCWR